MKKLFVAALALVMSLTFGFAGCDGNQDNVPDGTVELTVTINNSDAERALFLETAPAFEAYMAQKGVKVKVNRTPSTVNFNEYVSDIAKLYVQEELGDVIYTGDSYATAFIQDGARAYFDDLYNYLDEEFLSKFSDMALTSGVFNINGKNKLAFMPRTFDQVTCYINKKFFKDIGMEDDIPTTEIYGENWEKWTWTNVIKLLEKMREAIDTTYGKEAGSYKIPFDPTFSWNAVMGPIMKSFGGYPAKVEGNTIKLGFDPNNDEEGVYEGTVKALGWMQDLVNRRLCHYGNSVSFAEGAYGMWLTTRPNVVRLVDNDAVDPAFAPLPKFTNEIEGVVDETTYVGLGAMGYALNIDSKVKDVAVEYIKFLSETEGQKILCKSGNAVPILESERKLDGEWTQLFPGVDQSAFVWDTDDYDYYVASYARGIKPEYEAAAYTNVLVAFINGVFYDSDTGTKNGTELAAKIYNQVKPYFVF